MRTGNAEEARLKKLYQEADNERMQLHERVRTADVAISELQKLSQAQQKLIEDLQQQVRHYINAAAQWEVRFDRLLSVVSGQTTQTIDAAKMAW